MLRMIWLSGSVLLLLMALGVSSEEDQATIVVRYPKRELTPAKGSSVQLSCAAHHKHKVCGLLRVVWLRDSVELTDPSKYFITVNETLTEDKTGEMRERQVVMEIVDLNEKDSGMYQCSAECENKETAVGHNIHINVKD